MHEAAFSSELVQQHPWSSERHERIVRLLGREPSPLELDVFAVLASKRWSLPTLPWPQDIVPAAAPAPENSPQLENLPDTTQPLVNLKSVLALLRPAAKSADGASNSASNSATPTAVSTDGAASDATVLRFRPDSPTEFGFAPDSTSEAEINVAYCGQLIGYQPCLNPHEAAVAAVTEACRKLIATGATPVGIASHLNPAATSTADSESQRGELERGLTDAARAFGFSITLRQRSPVESADASPGITVVGILAETVHTTPSSFQNDGDAILLLGAPLDSADLAAGLGASAYHRVIHGQTSGRGPRVDLRVATGLHEAMRALICGGDVLSAHSCGRGGLLVAVADACLRGNRAKEEPRALGVTLDLTAARDVREDALLFGEISNRIVVTTSALNAGRLIAQAKILGATAERLGQVGGSEFKVTTGRGVYHVPIRELFDGEGNRVGPAAT